MSLQNRVNPYGEIVAIASRGAWMGNRGCLHGPNRQLTSTRWMRKQWVICELSFRDRHREVMTPGKYTELFFLDEATALAAGHRPCGTCRKAVFNEFVSAWSSLDVSSGRGLSLLDDTLHSQRAAVIGKAALPSTDLASIPDGCMIALERNGAPYLVVKERLFQWSFSGYVRGPDIARNTQVVLITPPAIRDIIARGYSPQLHPSAAGRSAAQPTPQSIVRESRNRQPAQSSVPPISSAPTSASKSTLSAGSSLEPLYKLDATPAGKDLYAYFAAILQVTGMDRGQSFPLNKFMRNFSGHESAGRIVKVGSGNFRLSETGIQYFRDRFQPGNPQHITQGEVDRFKQCILHGGGRGWSRIG